MASFDPTCEIIESNEELTPAIYSKGMQHSEVGLDDILYKHPLLKVGDDPLDDDLNKLFEMIHLKASAKGLGILHSGSASPSSKAALKRPVTVSSSHSPRREISEPVTLKQALRGLCISQAAELAAMKRLSKPVASPRVSEAGRIKNLYMSVVAEASNAGVSTDEKGCKGGTSTSGEKSTKKPENTSLYNRSHYSQFAKTAVQKDTGSIVKQKSSIRSADSSPRFPIMAAHKERGTTSKQKEKSSALTIVKDDHYKRKEPQLKGKNTSGRSLPHLESDEHVLEQRNNFPALTKLPERAPTAKLRRKVRLLQAVSSSSSVLSNGKRVNKLSRNNPRLVKSVTRKNCVKRKPKQDLTSSSRRFLPDACSDDASPGRNQQPICQRCHCALDNLGKEPDGSSLTSASIGGPNNGGFTSKPISTFPGSDGRSIIKFNSNSKSKDKAVFSHSSKSSLGEHSWSTGTSEESILSRPSHYSRPHMSKDVRWKAIQCVRKEHGTLGLSHFNLLKKLGCGDIGTVYLAELISTSCLFAIKVMDTEYLARRKKMPRAQTEREILKMLDHPFLPTLYAQFTSDNLSCLVMEYCPGGDLHVLRQKQPNRNFPEQAARFYVAEVLLALEYLHMLGVVYRDLKPENILVREDGHIMLTDFDLSLRCAVNPTLLNSSSSVIEPARVSGHCRGSNCIDPLCMEPSCRVPCFSPRIFPAAVKAQKQKSSLAGRLRLLPQLVAEPTEARSNSFVGTHEYLAPEIIKGEGHGSAVDWWTFGIFLYELLYGKTPFKGPGNEETLANVVFKSLKFPGSPMVSFQARDLIRGLLAKEPENRLGTQRGAAEIKHHPFFEGLNWALIRCAVPPEIPESYDYGLTTMAYRDTLVEHLDFELF